MLVFCCLLVPDGCCSLVVCVFLFSPFALLSSRVRHGAARLSWHGVERITCVQSLITSSRIDYYYSGLGSCGVTEEATKTLCMEMFLYVFVYCDVIPSLYALERRLSVLWPVLPFIA